MSILLYIIPALVLWCLIGTWAFNKYCKSMVEIRHRYEVLLVVLCGPMVWIIMTGVLLLTWRTDDEDNEK